MKTVRLSIVILWTGALKGPVWKIEHHLTVSGCIANNKITGLYHSTPLCALFTQITQNSLEQIQSKSNISVIQAVTSTTICLTAE